MVTLTGKHQDQTKNFFHYQILSHPSPHKKTDRCLSDINRRLTNISQF